MQNNKAVRLDVLGKTLHKQFHIAEEQYSDCVLHKGYISKLTQAHTTSGNSGQIVQKKRTEKLILYKAPKRRTSVVESKFKKQKNNVLGDIILHR